MILIYNNQKPHILSDPIQQVELFNLAPSPRENENQQVHITYVPLLQTNALYSQSHNAFTWGNNFHL